MIEKLLQKLGYVKGSYRDLSENPFTEAEVSRMLSNLIYVEDLNVDKEFDKKIFDQLRTVEGFVDYLRIMSDRDIRRYFDAQTPQEQLIARGAFVRANYFKGKILQKDDPVSAKLDGIRSE